MRRGLSYLLSGCVLALLVSACGGNNGASTDSSIKAQARTPYRSQKATAADYATLVQELYVAYFGRPADPGGLANFENSLAQINAPTTVAELAQAYNTNAAIKALIDTFGTSKESQTLYGTGTNQDFVTAIFKNVLNRTPASTGLAFWSGQIDSGGLSKGDAALGIMAGALANSSNSAQGQLDIALINNRINVAAYFSGQVSALNAVSAYSGSSAAAAARTFLSGVTSSSTAASYDAGAVAAVQALLSAVAASFPGNYCGVTTGSYPGTVALTLAAGTSGTYAVTGSVSTQGVTLPVSGATQPPAFNVELVCSSGGSTFVCGTVVATITPTAINGSYSTIDGGSGQLSLSRTCP
jgi:hypothetical protein